MTRVYIQPHEYGSLLDEDIIKQRGGPFKNKYINYGGTKFAVLTDKLVLSYFSTYTYRYQFCEEQSPNVLITKFKCFTKLPYHVLNTFIVYPRKLYFVNVTDHNDPLRILDCRKPSNLHRPPKKSPCKYRVYKGKTFRKLYTPSKQLFQCMPSEQIHCQILTASALFPYFTTRMAGRFDTLTFGEMAKNRKPSTGTDLVSLTKNLNLDTDDEYSSEDETAAPENDNKN